MFEAETLTQTEENLINIWSQIFDGQTIGPTDDFFKLGGNSITVIKMIAKIEAIYGEDALLPDTLFENGQLSVLARAIDEGIA